MTSSHSATVDQSNEDYRRCGFGRGGRRGRMQRRGNWAGLNIAVMVLAFIFFWPAGLLVLYWIASGRSVKELPAAISEKWSQLSGNWTGFSRFYENGSSDNVVFDDYQQTQYDRIKEIKDEIRARAKRFADFRSDAKRRADEEEFNRFMQDAPSAETGA